MNAILKGKEIVPTNDPIEWGKWFATANRHVGNIEKNGIHVSTVFLGIDYGFHGTPLWFETMIFGGEHDQFQERYETWEQAEAGHKRALKLVGLDEQNG